MTVPAAAKQQAILTKLEKEDKVIAEALSILARRIKKMDVAASSPNAIKTYLICPLQDLPRPRYGNIEWDWFKRWVLQRDQ